MSDAHPHHPEERHEGPIKTPKQLILAVVASFVIPIAVIVLLTIYVGSAPKPAAGSNGLSEEAIAQRLAKVGRVEIKDPSDATTLATGEQVYKAQCTACHGAGVAGAPKTGDTAAWAPRIATGYEALLNSALKGKGAMGAQGGGDYSDLEIGRAVVYLTSQAGGTFPEPKAPAAAGAAGASATNAAVAANTTQAANAAASAMAAVPAAPAAPAAAAAPAPTVAAAGPPALYTSACSVCHTAGIAGAPKTGDKASWAPRVATGLDGLTASAIKGKGAMPARGGSQATDAEIKAVVAYMLDSVK